MGRLASVEILLTVAHHSICQQIDSYWFSLSGTCDTGLLLFFRYLVAAAGGGNSFYEHAHVVLLKELAFCIYFFFGQHCGVQSSGCMHVRFLCV